VDSAYDLFMSGTRLLDHGDFHAAVVPLALATSLRPERADYRQYLYHARRRAA
jgi:hypothetical protein